jgi:hypothetical protein
MGPAQRPSMPDRQNHAPGSQRVCLEFSVFAFDAETATRGPNLLPRRSTRRHWLRKGPAAAGWYLQMAANLRYLGGVYTATPGSCPCGKENVTSVWVQPTVVSPWKDG